MLNRRHLRIKVLQILYAYYQSEDKDVLHVEKELYKSIDKMYELYVYLLLTFEELLQFAEQQIEDKQKRIQPSEEDLSPNRKFVDNPIFKHIQQSADLRRESENLKVNWSGAVKNDLMRKMWVAIKDSELYNDYLSSKETTFEDDRKFAVSLFKSEIANFELLHDYFENESIYWMDDIDLICSMVIKTIKSIEGNSKDVEILPLFKDEGDDKDFINTLLRKTLEKDDENTATVDDLTQNWELDRIAKMDIILLKMALTELLELQPTPKKVTLNEYIEISKYYSKPKSQVFINGILDKAVEQLDKEGKLIKTGRGLIN